MRPAAILIALALIVAIVVAVVTLNKDEQQPAAATGGEIFLQPVAEPGPDPFGPSVAKEVTVSTTTSDGAKTTTSRSRASEPSATATGNPGTSAVSTSPVPGSATSTVPSSPTTTTQPPTPPSSGGPLVITPQSGGTPGLYGGSRRLDTCDKQAMIDFLAVNPDKAAAWAAVQGIAASDVGRYISRLTSVVLLSDTRVTNHGFREGRANPFQAILQAGTAVLVDEYGTPRARCACGNPLVPPRAVPVTPSYQGQPWPGFTPTNVTVINPSTTIINVIIVIDIDNGDRYGIPTNPGGGTGTVSTTPTQRSTPPLTSPATARPTPTSATSGQGSTNWRFKSATFIPLTGQPDYQVSTPWTTTGGGITLTVHDSGTFCTGGGTETVRLTWTFDRDITNLSNGDTFLATANAAKVSATGGCGSGMAALTSFDVSNIAGDGSMPLTSFTRPPDRERFTGRTNSASADSYQGRQPTESATLGVNSKPSDAKFPEAGFHVAFYGPGLQFYVLYIYEQV